MLNTASLYSLNSAKRRLTPIKLNSQVEKKRELTPCVEPIGSQEHREEKNNHWVGSESQPQSVDFHFP
jgi:hypothetical protein